MIKIHISLYRKITIDDANNYSYFPNLLSP